MTTSLRIPGGGEIFPLSKLSPGKLSPTPVRSTYSARLVRVTRPLPQFLCPITRVSPLRLYDSALWVSCCPLRVPPEAP